MREAQRKNKACGCGWHPRRCNVSAPSPTLLKGRWTSEMLRVEKGECRFFEAWGERRSHRWQWVLVISSHLCTGLGDAGGLGKVKNEGNNKNKRGATEKERGRRLRRILEVASSSLRVWKRGNESLSSKRRLVRLLLLLIFQPDERPACSAPRCRDVILKPTMSCAGVSHVMCVSVRSGRQWMAAVSESIGLFGSEW